MNTKTEPMAGTQSVVRALTMLEAFTDERPAWNVSDLAEATGLNRTTTYRLLTALESAEYVARDPATDTYRLGSGLIAIGGRALRANTVRAISRPELEAIVAATGETASLEIVSGREVVIIEEIPGDYVTSIGQPVGSRWPIYATSTGKAILAHLPPGERSALIGKGLQPLTEKTVTSPGRLAACLDEVRAAGYAVADEELELGFVAVGAPVFDRDGRPVAAISLGGTLTRMTGERVPEIGRLVRAAAYRISHQLGYRPAGLEANTDSHG